LQLTYFFLNNCVVKRTKGSGRIKAPLDPETKVLLGATKGGEGENHLLLLEAPEERRGYRIVYIHCSDPENSHEHW